MALYHFCVTPISRKTRSAVAAAAYRAAVRLTAPDGTVFDYTRKRNIAHRCIIVPNGEPAIQRADLWNLAEHAERRRDARTAREIELALQSELLLADNIALAQKFFRTIAERYHIAVDLAVHTHGAGSTANIHVHGLMTTREYRNGTLTEKSDLEREDKYLKSHNKLSCRDQISELRALWADMVNDALRAHGITARVDHRTLDAQGITRPAQRHAGPAAAALARRGEMTAATAYNSAIRELYPAGTATPPVRPAVTRRARDDAAYRWRTRRTAIQQQREKMLQFKLRMQNAEKKKKEEEKMRQIHHIQQIQQFNRSILQ